MHQKNVYLTNAFINGENLYLRNNKLCIIPIFHYEHNKMNWIRWLLLWDFFKIALKRGLHYVGVHFNDIILTFKLIFQAKIGFYVMIKVKKLTFKISLISFLWTRGSFFFIELKDLSNKIVFSSAASNSDRCEIFTINYFFKKFLKFETVIGHKLWWESVGMEANDKVVIQSTWNMENISWKDHMTNEYVFDQVIQK